MMNKTNRFYIEISCWCIVIGCLFGGVAYAVAHEKSYRIINQETIAEEEFKQTQAYRDQQEFFNKVAAICEEIHGYGYRPDLMPPPVKPERVTK